MVLALVMIGDAGNDIGDVGDGICGALVMILLMSVARA